MICIVYSVVLNSSHHILCSIACMTLLLALTQTQLRCANRGPSGLLGSRDIPYVVNWFYLIFFPHSPSLSPTTTTSPQVVVAIAHSVLDCDVGCFLRLGFPLLESPTRHLPFPKRQSQKARLRCAFAIHLSLPIDLVSTLYVLFHDLYFFPPPHLLFCSLFIESLSSGFPCNFATFEI